MNEEFVEILEKLLLLLDQAEKQMHKKLFSDDSVRYSNPSLEKILSQLYQAAVQTLEELRPTQEPGTFKRLPPQLIYVGHMIDDILSRQIEEKHREIKEVISQLRKIRVQKEELVSLIRELRHEKD